MENMNPINGLIVVTVLVAGGYMLFKVASRVLKVVGIALTCGLAWYFWQGGTVSGLKDESIKTVFKQAPLTALEDNLCLGQKADRIKCECIVQPVAQDLTARLTRKELSAVSASPEERVTELRKSMRNRRREIRQCLVNNKGGEFLQKFGDVLEAAASER